jgi:transketolase
MAGKLNGEKFNVYAIVGDGECDEGIIWEAMMFAKHNALSNLTVIVDHNHLQADGPIEEVLDTAPLKEKLKSFGFDVMETDGHSVEAIYESLSCVGTSKPTAIIGESCKGHGVSFMENKAKWHHGSLNETRYNKALKELGGE